MNLREALAVINDMVAEGIVGTYAVGGAVGAGFYLEPTDTLDVDIFVALGSAAGGLLVSLAPIYDYLRARGCREQGQYVIVAGTPVQFLPPDSPLTEEALRNAVTKDIEGLPVRVFSAEYLAAVALHVGRPKDKLRLVQFLEFHALEETRFRDILERHRMTDRWVRFKHQVGLA